MQTESNNTNNIMNVVINKNTTYVKVTAGQENRMVGVAAGATFAELEEQVRRSFRTGERAQLDMRYVDEEQDKVCISSDEELRYALDFFAGRTMRLYLTIKGDNAESAKNDCAWANDACEERNQDALQQKLKEKLSEAGIVDVPEWRLRKIIRKWNGNVDQAVEAVRQRRERKAQRMQACAGAQMLPPPGFPPMAVGNHHGPHLGGHRHHGHDHHFKHHQHQRHEGEGERQETFCPKWRKFGHHHHGLEQASPARGCFRGPHPHGGPGPHHGRHRHGHHHGGPGPHHGHGHSHSHSHQHGHHGHGHGHQHGHHQRGCQMPMSAFAVPMPMPECALPPMMPHGGFPPHAHAHPHPHCHGRFRHCGGGFGGRRGPMFA